MTEVEVENTIIPHHHDVICGEGGQAIAHIGNLNYRELVERIKPYYISTPNRRRRFMSLSIVKAIASQDPPGRFLRKDKRSGKWILLSQEEAIFKTRKTFREKGINQRTIYIEDLIQSTPNQINTNNDENKNNQIYENENTKSHENNEIPDSSTFDSPFKSIPVVSISLSKLEPNTFTSEYESDIDMKVFEEDMDIWMNDEEENLVNTKLFFTNEDN